MSQDPKVVSIKPNLAARAAAGVSSLPAPLISVRDLTVGYLQSALGEMFDKADDNLFEMADKAGNNADQALFFEAMRNVRLQRHNVVKRTCDALALAAEQINTEAPSAAPAVTFELDTLSLVQPDELEETLRRITFMPAFTSSVSFSTDSVLGPIVQTILVFFMEDTLR